MEFRFSITKMPSLGGVRLKKEYDIHLDGIYSILFDICDCIDGHVIFSVCGFGDSHWPVDVRTDLPSFIEQVPRCKILAKAGKDFSIDFYEQGIQRTVEFCRSGEIYTATCTSGGTWVPSPQTIKIECLSIFKLLEEMLLDFSDIVLTVSPGIYNGLWFSRWLSGADHSH